MGPQKESADITSRSKWNKIEHRVFSFITINWRGKPLRSFRTIVQLIAATTIDTGLKVRAEIDTRKYPRGVKVSDAEMAALKLSCHAFYGEELHDLTWRQSLYTKAN